MKSTRVFAAHEQPPYHNLPLTPICGCNRLHVQTESEVVHVCCMRLHHKGKALSSAFRNRLKYLAIFEGLRRSTEPDHPDRRANSRMSLAPPPLRQQGAAEVGQRISRDAPSPEYGQRGLDRVSEPALQGDP